METRYATNPGQIPGMDTEMLREQYLAGGLFQAGTVQAVYTHEDRVVIAGAMPTDSTIEMPTYPEIRSERFFDHREAGIVNVGAPGQVTVDGASYSLSTGACLYVGRGVTKVEFASEQSLPAKFYIFSAPAHTAYPTALTQPGEGNVRELGEQRTSNRRTLNQYIHENGVRSCQVVMGVTTLHEGSMWNTMPAHTHERRTECYLYFDLPQEARILHILGQPTQTRHLVVANEEAIISPSWSVHSGVGTSAYSFVWAMAGENQSFDDMDTFPVADMR